MTKEQAIEFLKEYTETNFSERCREAHDMAIKALEQQPKDCVSRAEVLEMIDAIQDAGGFIGYNTYSEACYQVNNMPPVTPTRKVGKWEYKQLGFRKYGLVCTGCGYAIHIGCDFNSMKEFKDMIETKLQNPHITKDKYCCKCGAEMGGVEN